MKAFCYVLESFIELSPTHLKSLQEKEELEKHRATLEEKARPRPANHELKNPLRFPGFQAFRSFVGLGFRV